MYVFVVNGRWKKWANRTLQYFSACDELIFSDSEETWSDARLDIIFHSKYWVIRITNQITRLKIHSCVKFNINECCNQPLLSNFLAIWHNQSDWHKTSCNQQIKVANRTRPSPPCHPWHGTVFYCITDTNKLNISTKSAMVKHNKN